ncbi:MAG: sugar phosphate isomerase/epimerase family protein [Ginsengibacter sp.]
MNQHYSRRHFIKATATGLAGIAFTSTLLDLKKSKPCLSFSTLGCPDWSFDAILNFAVKHGYDGIEIRGLQRQLDLTKCAEFSSKENLLATRKKVEEKKIKIVDLGSSAAMHHADAAERKKNLDEAKNFIRLAQQLNCPYIRVFPNNFTKEQERNETIDLIVKGLLELGNYAKETGVTVLMETHGDLVQSADIENIMQLVGHPNIGIVWDMVNMWSVTKEPLAQVYAKLKKYIHLTHIKDLKFIDGKEQCALLGRGDTPILEAVDILAKDGYKGYYSFEWEKLWNPKIEEPEVALADYAKAMKRHFKTVFKIG